MLNFIRSLFCGKLWLGGYGCTHQRYADGRKECDWEKF